ncbi:unnamed protein product [Caenorhabditis angaria]|uniref:EGF-like domain-containing protein n=1 Tax=Caenorhabditis angaria TaxID=860376 RepID=A0A9P1IRL9_9PELO|nr:unnamed protein product [Caenorhabditis angaria]
MNYVSVFVFFVTLIFVFVFGQELEEEKDVDELLRKFNDDHVSNMKDEYSRIVLEGKQDELIVKIGFLAMYFRIFRKLVPVSYDDIGIEYVYQENSENFDVGVAENCTESLETCVDKIFSEINQTQSWISTDNMILDQTRLKNAINNQRLKMEVSVSQMLCYLTNSKIAAFSHLPYCNYKLNMGLTFFGKSFLEQNFIDEFAGGPFECAIESFCPDPCCKNLPDAVRISKKMQKKCARNNCKNPETCLMKAEENSYLYNLRLNKFNITCGCTVPGQVYRSDIGECVNHNQCAIKNVCREPFKECMNVASGYKCVCQLGYKMVENKCVAISLQGGLTEFHGFSYSEPLTGEASESKGLFNVTNFSENVYNQSRVFIYLIKFGIQVVLSFFMLASTAPQISKQKTNQSGHKLVQAIGGDQKGWAILQG